MTWEQYWDGDVWAVESFRKLDRIKKERKNQELWLQGMYFYEGLGCVVHNALKKKGDPLEHYPSEPYPLYENTNSREKIEEDEVRLARIYMNNMMRAGKNWGKGAK